MRGVVSLAAALALPLMISANKPFPNRNLIIFLTFCVIFSTLVIQGLTLRPLIKWLGIKGDGSEAEHEHKARLKIASTVIEHIEENYALTLHDEVLNQIKTKYEIRIQRMRNEGSAKMTKEQIHQLHEIQKDLLKMERNLIVTLRRDGSITDEVLRKLEYELDLEETRLILERSMS
jgi:monovalent cation/hydrogen antiporter